MEVRYRWLVSWFVYPPQIALPFVTAYAVLVDNVLEVRMVVRQGLTYLLTNWFIRFCVVAPFAALLVYVYSQRALSLSETMSTPHAQVLLLMDGLAILLLVFRPRLLRLVDRWALSGVEDAASVLASMTDRMMETRTPLEIASVFVSAAERVLRAPASAYLIRDGQLVPVREGAATPPGRSLIPSLLEGAREPCVVSSRYRQSYFSLLPERDRAWVDRETISILVPIVAARGQRGLLGVIALMERRNAVAFSPDELRFVRAAAAATRLACDALQADVPAAVNPQNDLDELSVQCGRCGRVDIWTVARSCSCGGTWEPAALPKYIAGRLDIVQFLGAGGMGIVYRATDLTLHRDVAVKTLPRLSEGAAARLLTEGRMMASLTHSQIAILYGVEQWRGTPLLVMEYLAGGTLASRLRNGPLPAADAIAVVSALASALVHVHRAGKFHGDIKPSNIAFNADGEPKLLDFGLARAVSESHEGLRAGTLAYLTPEVRDGAAPGPELDVWALCVVLCEMLAGTHPFLTAETPSQIASGAAATIRKLPDGASDPLRRFLMRALTPHADRQPRTATGLIEALAVLQ